MIPSTEPNKTMAARIVMDALGWHDAQLHRFTTGLAFFVYDIRAGQRRAVIRMGRPGQAGAMASGLALWRRLVPLGVPLPDVLVDGTGAQMPFVIMARLPGTDLGDIMDTLPELQLHAIAQAVADAQKATAQLGPGSTFGYAATAAAAPHARWGDVVAAHLDRSARRIAANGLFPLSVVDGVAQALARQRPALDAMAPTPFLHDTTTKNVIVTPEGDFSGIVDVDDLCFGDPRYAPSLTRAALLVHGGPQLYVTAWLDRIGLADDAVFALYVAAFLLDFMSEHGMTFNGNQRPSEPADRDRLSLLLAHTLRDAS